MFTIALVVLFLVYIALCIAMQLGKSSSDAYLANRAAYRQNLIDNNTNA